MSPTLQDMMIGPQTTLSEPLRMQDSLPAISVIILLLLVPATREGPDVEGEESNAWIDTKIVGPVPF